MKNRVLIGGLIASFAAGIGITAVYYQLVLLPWGKEFLYLVLSGGLGGIAQALASGGDRLRCPGLVDEVVDGDGRPAQRKWDAGFLADVFIGMLGAVASLMFALALLSDKFFGAVQGEPSAVLIPAWARIIAFGALAGFASRQLLPALSKRLSSMVAEEVRDRVGQFEQRANNQIEATRAQAEAARLTALAAQPPALPTAAGVEAAPAGGAPREWIELLRQLIAQYDALQDADYEARVAARMRIADEMLVALSKLRVTSADLLAVIQNQTNKTWVLPLATMIASRPDAADAARLFEAYRLRFREAADRNDGKFILYRILLAIVALRTTHLLTEPERQQARLIALECREINEPSLRKRADSVLSLLG